MGKTDKGIRALLRRKALRSETIVQVDGGEPFTVEGTTYHLPRKANVLGLAKRALKADLARMARPNT